MPSASYTTSSEWLGEVGDAIVEFLSNERGRAPDEVVDLLNACLKEVGRVWPKYPRGPIIGFVTAILAVGLLRFVLTVSGVPDEITRYASMTVVILAASLYFGIRRLSSRDILGISYLLILPYMAVELAALGYTWATGRTTIFHAGQYSFGLPLQLHFWGHLLGGLTWEPLCISLVMLLVRTVSTRWRARVQPGPP